MDINIKKHEPFWGDWYIEEIIGSGSFGSVYKISKKSFDITHFAALKHITLPTKEQYQSVVNLLGTTDKNVLSEYFKDNLKNIINEINILYNLKGNSNIISYEDYLVIEKDTKDGFDIFIRMEYATPLDKYIQSNKLSQNEIIKIGIDIATGLEVCHQSNVIHRDIKEANLFYANNRNFKIGDFGVSKKSTETVHAYTKVGTLFYMAPEIINNQNYTSNVDIYSLGMLMYKLLNNNKIPFLPDKNTYTPLDIEKAQISRLKGEIFPTPSNVDNQLISIILKACEFDPNKRYQSITDFKNDLLKLDLNNINTLALGNKSNEIVNTIESNSLTNTTSNSTLHIVNDNTKKVVHTTETSSLSTKTSSSTIHIKNNTEKIQKVSYKKYITIASIIVIAIVLISYMFNTQIYKKPSIVKTSVTSNNTIVQSNFTSALSNTSSISPTPINSQQSLEPTITNTQTNITNSNISTKTSSTMLSTNPVVSQTKTVTTTSVPTPKPVLSSLYRCLLTNGLHFYTTDSTESKSSAVGVKSIEDTYFILRDKQPNSLEFLRYRGPANHLYVTKNTQLINDSLSNYTFEASIGYIYTKKVSNSVPFYMYYRSSIKDYFYSTDTTPDGYISLGIVGYLFENNYIE